jgi:peptidoglycan/xylan/chitin deacetylase (PgdA/CDA1 family)
MRLTARWSRLAAPLAAALAGLLAVPALAAGQTVVSMTFDDGHADQYTLRPMLASRGLNATFFVNTGVLGQSGRMTWEQLQALAADGNEIAGHTLTHPDLNAATATELRRQVCDDRANLVAHGYPATDFAYPFGHHDAASEAMVQTCGYNSARGVGGIVSPGYCPYCDTAEQLPPAYPWYTLTPQDVEADTSLATIEGYVTQAEQHGGGWVELVFHHVCDGCDTYSVSPATMSAFLDWLAQRASAGTVVKTVQQVVGGPAQPAPAWSDSTPPVSTVTCSAGCTTAWAGPSVTVSLAASDDDSGVAAIRYTTDGSDPTPSSPAYSGPLTIGAPTTLRFRAWDRAGNAEATRSQALRVDGLAPTATLTSPTAGARVRGTVTLRATAADADSGIAQVRYAADGRAVGASTTAPYSVAWDTRPLARGYHRITATAIDRVGNSGLAVPVTVWVR